MALRAACSGIEVQEYTHTHTLPARRCSMLLDSAILSSTFLTSFATLSFPCSRASGLRLLVRLLAKSVLDSVLLGRSLVGPPAWGVLGFALLLPSLARARV